MQEGWKDDLRWIREDLARSQKELETKSSTSASIPLYFWTCTGSGADAAHPQSPPSSPLAPPSPTQPPRPSRLSAPSRPPSPSSTPHRLRQRSSSSRSSRPRATPTRGAPTSCGPSLGGSSARWRSMRSRARARARSGRQGARRSELGRSKRRQGDEERLCASASSELVSVEAQDLDGVASVPFATHAGSSLVSRLALQSETLSCFPRRATLRLASDRTRAAGPSHWHFSHPPHTLMQTPPLPS